MDKLKFTDNFPYFVRLQMTDKMPFGFIPISFPFRLGVLPAIFANLRQTTAYSFSCCFKRNIFSYCNNLHFFAFSATTQARFGYQLFYFVCSFLQRHSWFHLILITL